MVAQLHLHTTIEEFEQYALLPENADRRLQYIGGGDR